LAKIKCKSGTPTIHGRTGNVIFYNVYGYQYVRSYSIPYNPGTGKQQSNRTTFAEAAKLWQYIPAKDKSFYNRLAYGKPLSGYNIFVSMQKKGITTEILKLIHKHQRYSRFIPDACRIGDTSVYASSFTNSALSQSCRDKNLRINQPKELALAS